MANVVIDQGFLVLPEEFLGIPREPGVVVAGVLLRHSHVDGAGERDGLPEIGRRRGFIVHDRVDPEFDEAVELRQVLHHVAHRGLYLVGGGHDRVERPLPEQHVELEERLLLA